MKAITEFANVTLTKGLKTKAALTTEGKSPEEIQAGLGEAFKFEGDKLKHFMNAIDVAEKNQENLKRVMVVSLNEGEAAPQKAVKIEETHYIPDFVVASRPAAPEKGDRRGGRGGRRGGGDSKKSSPWGLTPEEKAAKGGAKPKQA